MKKKRRQGHDGLRDDKFSLELKKQGEDGKIMAKLYLRNEMEIYRRKVSDEPI